MDKVGQKSRVFPNGSIEITEGAWGDVVRLEKVPRLPLYPRGEVVGIWEGNQFVGFGKKVWGRGVVLVKPENRHSFNVIRGRWTGYKYAGGKYHLWFSELDGGWCLI